MADIHVSKGGSDSHYHIIMHLPSPGGNNSVGVAWSTALVNSGLGGSTSLPDGDGADGTISTAEKASIEAGTLYEHSKEFPAESGGTSNAELRASLREFHSQEKISVTALLQTQLRYFGHTESEA